MDKNKKHYKSYPKKLKLSPKDDRDYKLKDIDLETAPRKVVKVMKGKPLPKKYKSLIINNKYVFDQEETGMCVACSLAQMWHIMTRLLNHTSIKFSPAKVYSDRELKDGEDGYGMTAREAISNTINHGICSFTNFKTISEYPKVRKQYLKFKSQLDNISKYFRADTYYTCNGSTQKETIQNIKKLCEISHAHGALFHTDAVQAVGHLQMDVHDLGVDFLSASAHKFNGPRGIGFLYVRKGVSLAPFMHGGKQEYGMRAGTENVAQIVGMATALKDNCERIAENKRHIKRIEEVILQTMDSSGISYKRNGTHQIPGLLSLSFPNQDGEAILHRLDLHKICISTGSACDSVRTEISHVLKAIQLDNSFAKGTIRISFGVDNTEEDAKIIAAELIQIVK